MFFSTPRRRHKKEGPILGGPFLSIPSFGEGPKGRSQRPLCVRMPSGGGEATCTSTRSASYCWSRVPAAAVGLITRYLCGRSATTWHQLVADDCRLEAGGKDHRAALISFFVLCASAGVPLSWGKTAGGDVLMWVGFELHHHTHQLGTSEQRAAWFTKGTRQVASSQTLNIASFEEGLERVIHVAGALVPLCVSALP